MKGPPLTTNPLVWPLTRRPLEMDRAGVAGRAGPPRAHLPPPLAAAAPAPVANLRGHRARLPTLVNRAAILSLRRKPQHRRSADAGGKPPPHLGHRRDGN